MGVLLEKYDTSFEVKNYSQINTFISIKNTQSIARQSTNAQRLPTYMYGTGAGWEVVAHRREERPTRTTTDSLIPMPNNGICSPPQKIVIV
jgi:hypothetical protein